MGLFRGGVLFLAGALLSFAAYADTVVCKDGRVFEGEILSLTLNTVRIRTLQGTETLPRSAIQSIERNESVFQALRKKRAALDAADAEGRWALVAFCEEKNLQPECVELLRELRELASPFYVKATLKLAEKVESGDPKAAIQFLDDLAAKTGDAEARIKSKRIKEQLDAKRSQAYQDALEAYRDKRWPQTFEGLRNAFGLSYPGLEKAGKEQVTEETILQKLVSIRKELATAAKPAAQEPATGAATGVLSCTVCPHETGWSNCSTCKGTGNVTTMTQPIFSGSGIIPARKVTVKCGDCKGEGMARCKACNGSGLNPAKLPGKLGLAVRLIANDAWGLSNKEPEMALHRIQQKASDGRMILPDGYHPLYAASKELRGLLPHVPVGDFFMTSDKARTFKSEWLKAPPQVRANLLCCYACEVAKSALPEVGHAGGEQAVEVRAEDFRLADYATKAATVDAPLISAFPEDWGGKWVYVEAVFKGPDRAFSGADRWAFGIEALSAHNLRLWVYLPESKGAHRASAAQLRPLPYLKAIAAHYPYEKVSDAAKGLKPGDRIRMLGRVLYREDRNPEATLEVWNIETFLDEQTQRKLALIRKQVTFKFQDTPLGEALHFLSLLTGTKVRLNAPNTEELMVNQRVAGKTLAFALSEMLKELKLEWTFDEQAGGLVVLQKPVSDAIHERDRVLGFMHVLGL